MAADLGLEAVSIAWVGCMVLLASGAAIQVAIGAGLSVVCGAPLILWFGPAIGVPLLLSLNLVVSVVATAFGIVGVRWPDAALASAAILLGCGIAWCLPPLSEPVLKVMTACVLVAVALPRPPAPEALPSASSVRIGVTLASMATGALTVWTATPGPILPAAFARAGRSGADIRRTMQPISIVGYGTALAWADPSSIASFSVGQLTWFGVALILGTTAGFRLRSIISPPRIVMLVRAVAGVAALLLLASLFW